MKNKRNTYCTYEFWEEFFRLEMSERISLNREQRRLWLDFFDFLEKSDLHFDISKKKINKETEGGKALTELFRRRGGANIDFLGDKFPNFEILGDSEDEWLNSCLLCTKDTHECSDLSQRLGIIVLNLDMVFSSPHMYKDNGIVFTRSQANNWSFLKDLKEKCPSICYCNSLVIVDRYLLADTSEKVLNTNLRPIMDALLPEQLDNGIVFTICIISQKMGKNQYAKLEKIKGIINKIRPELEYRLNIYNSTKLHDRSILTNNILLMSGAGFDVIGTDETPLKFTTTLLEFPFLQNNRDHDNFYLEWINNVLNAESSCRKFEENYWGDEDTHHHLLDYYYEEPVIPHTCYALGDAFADLLKGAITA